MIRKEMIALFGLALLMSACAASRGPQSAVQKEGVASRAPRDRVEARRQLAYYIAQLERGSRAMGLRGEGLPRREHMVARPVPAPAAPVSGAAAESSDSGTRTRSAKRARPRRSPRARVSAAPPRAAHGPSADDAGGSLGSGEDGRCPMACRHTRAICDAARHICKLADYLDEDDARIRCGRAQEDCRRARERTHGRCHDCE